MNFSPTVIGVCGFSGSGKTSLIEAALPELRGRMGLAVSVVKHDRHGFDLDVRGKDTDRFGRAGADAVGGHDGGSFFKIRREGVSLSQALAEMGPASDLILIEGHKEASIRKIWLEGPEGKPPSTRSGPVLEVLPWAEENRLGRFLEKVRDVVETDWRNRPARFGLLIGGKSSRMGRPKTLLDLDGEPISSRIVTAAADAGLMTVFLGSGLIPSGACTRLPCCLPDAPGVGGPMAGLLSGMRWDPVATWVLGAVDMPGIKPEVIRWLLGLRKPGVWAILPRLRSRDRAEPLLACYEPMILPRIETLAAEGERRLRMLVGHPRVISPEVPEDLEGCFTNINTADEWEKYLEGRLGESDPANSPAAC